MSLGYEVLRFIDRVRRQPDAGTDPRLLARLEEYARNAFEGIVALHAPASPMTWEINTFLDGTVQTTQRNCGIFCQIQWVAVTRLPYGARHVIEQEIRILLDDENLFLPKMRYHRCSNNSGKWQQND
jgi:hypothetical protein